MFIFVRAKLLGYKKLGILEMVRYHIDKNIKRFQNNKGKGYTYHIATITILRKRYTKLFSFTDQGYKDAERWLLEMKKSIFGPSGLDLVKPEDSFRINL